MNIVNRNKIKHERTTSGIANKGFSGMRRFIARFNFSFILIGYRPQSLTGHTANRYVQFENLPFTERRP